VHLSVVSGKPISFIHAVCTRPRYVQRPTGGELAENKAVAPVGVQRCGEAGVLRAVLPSFRPAPRAKAISAGEALVRVGGFGGGAYRAAAEASTITSSEGRGRRASLFEYSFGVAGHGGKKKGESAMLPFLQQKVNTAKGCLIYSENSGLHPMDAAEITNSTRQDARRRTDPPCTIPVHTPGEGAGGDV